MIEEKFLKIDELARNVDKISLDVDSLKLRYIPPKHDINESLKAMRIFIDECKERTTRKRAKKDAFIRACSSSSYENKDEDCWCQNRRISGRGSQTVHLGRMVTGGRGHDVLPRSGPS